MPILTSAARQRKFRKGNPAAARAAKKRYMAKRGWLIEKHRHLHERYGLTADAFSALLASQNNACAVCEKPFTETALPCVDHHHGTGRIRGLLHRACNAALGIFQDSPTILRRAADYVDQEDTCQ